MDFVQKALSKVIFKDSIAQYVFDYRRGKLFFFSYFNNVPEAYLCELKI